MSPSFTPYAMTAKSSPMTAKSTPPQKSFGWPIFIAASPLIVACEAAASGRLCQQFRAGRHDAPQQADAGHFTSPSSFADEM